LSVGVHAGFGEGAVALVGGQRLGLGLVSQCCRRHAKNDGEQGGEGGAESGAVHGLFELTCSWNWMSQGGKKVQLA